MHYKDSRQPSIRKETSFLEFMVALVTILNGIAQILNICVHIPEYTRQPEAQSIQFQATTLKPNSTK